MKTIRKASLCELNEIESIYESARKFMRETGNLQQWTGGYPSREVIEADIAKGALYVCESCGELLGVFYFAEEEDPTYREIYGGSWKNTLPYAVIHRIALSDRARGRGVASFIFDECYAKCRNLKIDTHRDNLPMQRALLKNGFAQCGIIYLASGDERIAFQRC